MIQHVEAPLPSPKNDEVLIKVEASSINPIDCKVQNGFLRPLLPRRFPFIPGNKLHSHQCSVYLLL